MTNAYCNMSAPPRSKIQKVVRPVGKQVAFNMDKIGLEDPSGWLTLTYADREALINDWLTDFVCRHKAELDAVARPTGFMVGSVCEAFSGPQKTCMKEYPSTYIFCTDPILTVAVIGRMAGLVYVPRRELRLTENSFYDTFAFPAKYFPQYCGGRRATALPGDGRARTPCAPQSKGDVP